MPERIRLTTSSYAVLGLLAIQPWLGWALAQQMQRSLRIIWPRAEYLDPDRQAPSAGSSGQAADMSNPRRLRTSRWVDGPGVPARAVFDKSHNGLAGSTHRLVIEATYRL